MQEENDTPQPVLPNWRELLLSLKLTGVAYALAANCTLVAFAKNKMTLALSANHESMLNQKLKDRIQDALTNYFAKPIHLAMVTTTHMQDNTPLKEAELEQQKRLANAKTSVMQDPRVKQLIEMYDATIEVSLT